MTLEIFWVSIIVCGSGLLALWIDSSTVFRMFLSRTPRKTELMNPQMWKWFRGLNWLISWVFVISLYLVLKLENRMALLVCFLSLAYLTACFGVSLVFNEMEGAETQKEMATLTPDQVPIHHQFQSVSFGCLKLIPVVYMVGLFSIVWYMDTNIFLRLGIVLGTVAICSASAFVLQSRQYHTIRLIQQLKTWCYRIFQYISLTAGFVYLIRHVLQWNIKSYLDNDTTQAIGVSILCIVLYVCWFAPRSPKATVKESLLYQKRMKSYPPAYPNGWYALARSEDVLCGEVIPVNALGKEFVVYRSESGIIGILDAYCKHMGAHLAHGGRVEGNSIVCPFHEWKFNTDGTCTDIPYCKSIPSSANANAYVVLEYHGFVLMYLDAERRAPTYFPKPVDDIASQMVYRGQLDSHLNMHLIEFCENSADYQHFSILHGKMLLPFTQIPIPGITINHSVGFECDAETVIFKDSASLNFMGRLIPRSGAKASITICGPAGVTHFRFMTELGDIVMFQMHTPTEPLRLKVRFRWYAEPRVPKWLVWYVIGNWVSQIESDRMVWENKVFLPKPTLVKNDGPIKRVRRWFHQFYSEHSKSVGQDPLDW